MNKKFGFISLAVLLIAISILGTMAYFTDIFSSDENEAVAATFNVDTVNADGETIGDGEFDLDEKLYPGMDQYKVYEFFINKNDTEVPVEYSVNLSPSGGLFPGDDSSPVELTLQRNIDGEWVDVAFSETFQPESDTESYQIFVEWPHGDNDIAFQSLTGNVALEVTAAQVDYEEEPEEPAITGEILFQSFHRDPLYTTSNKEINFYLNDEGERVAEILMGSDSGAFEEEVGNITITSWDTILGKRYQIVTQYDRHISEANPLVINLQSMFDLSDEGVVTYQRANIFINIESDELYEWILED